MSIDQDPTPAAPESAPSPEPAPVDEGMSGAQWFRLAVVGGLLVWLTAATGIYGLAMVLGIVVMIFLHELGHFVMAKRAGMKVTEFFLGFGPRIWSVHRGETEYGLKLIPAGAYVKIIGMHDIEEVDPADESRTYRQKPFWARIGVAVAGSTMHFLIALVLLYTLLVGFGLPGGSVGPRRDRVAGLLGERRLRRPGRRAPGGRRHRRRRRPARPHLRRPARCGDRSARRHRGPHRRARRHHPRGGGHPRGQPEPARRRVPRRGRSRAGREAVARRRRCRPPSSSSGPSRSSPSAPSVGCSPPAASPTSAARWPTPATTPTTTTPDAAAPPSASASTSDQASAETGRTGCCRCSACSASASTPARGVAWPPSGLLFALINIFIGLFNLVPLLPFDGGHVAIAVYERIQEKRKHLTGRYLADVAKLLPLTYAVVGVLGLIFVSTLYLDIRNPLSRGLTVQVRSTTDRRPTRSVTLAHPQQPGHGGRRCPGVRPVDDHHQDRRRRRHPPADLRPGRRRRRHRALHLQRRRCRRRPGPASCPARRCRWWPTSTTTTAWAWPPWRPAWPACASTRATSAGPSTSRPWPPRPATGACPSASGSTAVRSTRALYEKHGGTVTPEAMVESAQIEMAHFDDGRLPRRQDLGQGLQRPADDRRLPAPVRGPPTPPSTWASPRPGRCPGGSSSPPPASAPCWPRASATPSATRSPPTRSRRPRPAAMLLEALGLRERTNVDLIACPSCGRAEIDVIEVAAPGPGRLRRPGDPPPGGGHGLRGQRAGRGQGRRHRHRRRQQAGPPVRQGPERGRGARGRDGRLAGGVGRLHRRARHRRRPGARPTRSRPPGRRSGTACGSCASRATTSTPASSGSS